MLVPAQPCYNQFMNKQLFLIVLLINAVLYLGVGIFFGFDLANIAVIFQLPISVLAVWLSGSNIKRRNLFGVVVIVLLTFPIIYSTNFYNNPRGFGIPSGFIERVVGAICSVVLLAFIVSYALGLYLRKNQ